MLEVLGGECFEGVEVLRDKLVLVSHSFGENKIYRY